MDKRNRKEQNEMMNGILTGRIDAEGTGNKLNTLACVILANGTKYIEETTYEYVGCATCMSDYNMTAEQCYSEGVDSNCKRI